MNTIPDISLDAYLHHKKIDPALTFLVEKIAASSVAVAQHLDQAALHSQIGSAGTTNIQGEDQKLLDVLADCVFRETCAQAPSLAAYVSEEVEDVTWLKDPVGGDLILYVDPLDGSSNLGVNLSVGSIFAVAQVHADGDRNVLRQGREYLCAGYAIYGPSTLFVISFGVGVAGFTLDPSDGSLKLTNARMQIPPETGEFAVNLSRRRFWDEPIRRYVDECLAGSAGTRGRNFNMRWTASMVADVHRILTGGGIFLYPADEANRSSGGKLRLMYEANPMAFLVNAAGGLASTGYEDILLVQPQSHHQRISVLLGSSDEVRRLVQFNQAQVEIAS
ncbi:class 1 fructose-bisphosphatase (plasmid) [Agrobacterium rosae]|uniref:Fructose-1,6-bisphosphatase class 1 n=1 Tax=Agrobacterium rosae TaxID=1972867 RepID=A0AAW9FKP8_9HYPH|nr:MULTISPECIES: class 1 fructose-bisphosphatase [Agrobacterium]MDX8321409.1 class 1 fructose-bisphosphatase [Agrobacterium sp. rho-8.1]MDX8305127.1 class 1 fructose-bisphosphatase [Agrobacterium rosae]MDX8310949.1 class 1 fructose-bisphosphatase [Agrobacterium sp. rho-13.3]MDX8316156.1 class 1 fructose-bisphosphatase [Agrobacterium rosae]MDX8327217.1 class 1 fructose-bisphosphatase [Agrobacterium tumefaciens]